jgi:hypothetical protein
MGRSCARSSALWTPRRWWRSSTSSSRADGQPVARNPPLSAASIRIGSSPGS